MGSTSGIITLAGIRYFIRFLSPVILFRFLTGMQAHFNEWVKVDRTNKNILQLLLLGVCQDQGLFN